MSPVSEHAPDRARALMVLGTASHVGKSVLTAALCRILRRQGYRVAPFKSQNMSLNSAATPEGLEIGRAQALQAEAAGVAASVHMNPILLKPSGEMRSQVIVRGRVWGQMSAAEYQHRRVRELMPLVRESYETLAATHDVIVLEGAGSPAEINLKQHDIANLRMAEMAGAACLLVGDIDRGGVFASLLGTVELLEPEERARIRGFAVNKFRGDPALLEPGLRMMEARIGIPSVGVVAHLPGIGLEEEDSLGLPPIATSSWPAGGKPDRALRIAVVALPSLSNFTDFDALRAEPSVELRLVRTPEALAGADVLLLPGSKQTADDLRWLRGAGLAEAVQRHAVTGLAGGICGGMQMLGTAIDDPHAMEGGGSIAGLGLLPIRTVLEPHKRTVLVRGRLATGRLFGQPAACELSGYEIHLGRTVFADGAEPFALLQHGPDGAVDTSSRIFGTYLHGVFDDDSFRHLFLRNARTFHQLSPPQGLVAWRARREAAIDAFATHVERSLDLACILGWIGLPYRAPGEAR